METSEKCWLENNQSFSDNFEKSVKIKSISPLKIHCYIMDDKFGEDTYVEIKELKWKSIQKPT